jgi:hypothetical protein
MSICEKNIIPSTFSEEIVIENIKKEYGLFPINNIKTNFNICTELFEGPRYYTNLTKLNTGLTETSIGVFNITNNNLFFTVNFTGNTDTLTAYTGTFDYQIYERTSEFIPPNTDNLFGSLNTIPQLYTNNLVYSASTDFSAITLNPFVYTKELNVLFKKDQEYILNTNYTFIKNNCLSKGFKYVEPNLGNFYDENSSWFFVTLVDPEKPRLGPFDCYSTKCCNKLLSAREIVKNECGQSYVFKTEEVSFINETLNIDPLYSDTFTISKKPLNNTLLVTVNGITLSSSNYKISGDTTFVLIKGLDPLIDVITSSYLTSDLDFNIVYSEQYEILSAVTSGVTSAVTTTDKVYYNIEEGKFEYYLEYKPSKDVEKNMTLFLNGIKLTYGLDYYLSLSIENRLIFDGINLSIGDRLYAAYTNDGCLEGNYNTVTYGSLLEWNVSPTIVNDRLDGDFLVEVTEDSDPNFITGVTTGITVNYVDGESYYYVNLPPNLQANKNYIWRVTNKKVYSGILDNIFTTNSVSRIGKFSTNNKINSY